MVTFPPLSPSASWFSHFLKAYARDGNREEAIKSANALIESPKVFGRYSLIYPDNEIFSLSVAVEGGGRQLRSFSNIETLSLSEHGNWRKNHLGAIETALGRKPFFRHFKDHLREIYTDRNLCTLRDFNTAIFQLLFSFLMQDIDPPLLKSVGTQSPIRERALEIKENINPQISVIQAIADMGRESLLGLGVTNQ